jgi:rod shape-determining protein MreC
VFLMVSDTRFGFVKPIRDSLATALLPAQRALNAPVQLAQDLAGYLAGLRNALAAEKAARAALIQQAERAARATQLAEENVRLRGLLGLRASVKPRSLSAEVMYEARDPYARRLFIDRGQTAGVLPGSPVIDAAGLLGQVTRVYPLSAEVTLLTDREATVPVLNTRTQQRGVVSGGSGTAGAPAMELRFMAANADVQVGDLLVTNGLDGIFPAGLAVATVQHIERRADNGFARIVLEPRAPSDAVRQVLVLEPLEQQLPPRPDEAAADSGELGAAAARPASGASSPSDAPKAR